MSNTQAIERQSTHPQRLSDCQQENKEVVKKTQRCEAALKNSQSSAEPEKLEKKAFTLPFRITGGMIYTGVVMSLYFAAVIGGAVAAAILIPGGLLAYPISILIIVGLVVGGLYLTLQLAATNFSCLADG